MTNGFGGYDPTKKANSNRRSKRFYLNEGSNLYRILPPTKSLRDKNKIAQFWSVIWLTDSNNRKRPVASILRKQGKDVLQNDPLLDKLALLTADLSHAISRNENPGVINLMKENLKRIRNDKGYHLNVLSSSGEYGVLSIPYTSYVNLEKRLAELGNMGIDAIGIGPDKGIYLDFKRLRDDRGKSIYPVDPATKNTRNEQGRYTMDYIYAPLTNEEATRLADQAEDLTQLFKTLSLEEMTALSTMDQRVFDTVFARGQAVVEESDTPVDNETQDQLSQYQSAHAAPATPNYQQPNGGYGQTQGLTTAGPATTQPSAQKTSQTSPSINFSSKPPEGPVFTQGSVVDNKKVQNFLFPDKKS